MIAVSETALPASLLLAQDNIEMGPTAEETRKRNRDRINANEEGDLRLEIHKEEKKAVSALK